MQRLELGPRAYLRGAAVATLSFTPLFDRAAIVTDIRITAPSANDTWTVTVGGREIMRFRVLTVGNQQLLYRQFTTSLRARSLFDWARKVLGTAMDIPVRQGLSCVVASVGGATADLFMEFKEVSPDTLSASMINHDQGNHFIMPSYGSLAASQTAVGTVALDTNVAPGWVPNIWTGVAIPVNFAVKILAYFLEPASVNTFSGAANHVSRTQFLQAIRNGQVLFSRANEGIPLKPQDAAAGSANTVFDTMLTEYEAFQNALWADDNTLDPPLQLNGGDLITHFLSLAGDETGGASYANALQVALIDVVTGGG